MDIAQTLLPVATFPLTEEGDVIAPDGSVFARWAGGSVLSWPVAPADTRIMLWSGTMAQGESEPPDADASFLPDPRNWGASGWSGLDSAVQKWIRAGRGSSLLVRTHAAHIVSDAPSATRFARTWADQGVRLVYDLASMITPELAGSAALSDLFGRRVDALTNVDLARGVGLALVSNVQVQSGRVHPSPMHWGLLESAQVIDAAVRCQQLGIPVAIVSTDQPAGDIAS